MEVFLAKLLVESAERERFLEDPRALALQAGLSAAQADALEDIDREGLMMAAQQLRAQARQAHRRALASQTAEHHHQNRPHKSRSHVLGRVPRITLRSNELGSEFGADCRRDDPFRNLV